MATVTGLVEAASMMFVNITTGTELRPATTAKVVWIGSSTQPIHMAEGDLWFRPASTTPTLPNILTSVLNTLTQGAAFSQALTVDGTPPFTFSVVTGSLPAGLSLNSTSGLISGTPSAAGSYSFTIQAANAVGSDTQAFSGTVTSSAVAPNITTTSLSSLTQGVSFSQTIAATGTSPLAWTISAGTLPAGLSLNSSTGAITGTPTGTGSYSFTVQATNSAGNDTQAFSGTISSSGTAPAITTTSLTTLTEGVSFSQTLARTGSTPMTWGISAGTLPSGLALNSSTGVISGIPDSGTAGSYSFTVQVTNSFGNDTQLFTGTVEPGSDADVYSIFGSTVPATLTSYSDASAGDWLTHTFYAAGAGLASGSKIIGARLYVPTGSAHIGQTWKAGLITSTGGYYPGLGTFPYADYNTNGRTTTGAALVAGWNEITFSAEYNVPAVGGAWYIGIQIGTGTRYLAEASLSSSAIQNGDGKNFYLSETGGSPISRHFYNASTTSPIKWYGIDTMVRIPA